MNDVTERVARLLALRIHGNEDAWVSFQDDARAVLHALEIGDILPSGVVTSFDLWENEKRVAAEAMRERCAKEAEDWALETASGSDAGLVIATAIRELEP